VTDILVLVHTVARLVGEFDQLCDKLLPNVRVLHIVDEPIAERIRQHGSTTAEDAERLAEHAELAEDIGADAVLVTCSTLSPCVDTIRDRFRMPVVTIDHATVVEALRLGTRIAVVATAATALEASRNLLLAEARRAGKPVDISLRLEDVAGLALLSGDETTHDRLVERAVREEAERSDVVVLAQASMARALTAIAGRSVPVPVLSGPVLALHEVRAILLKEKSAQT
jgi:Asp/Glu/hydantoin racemase